MATSAVVVDGDTLIDGSTANAQIETFEDNDSSRALGDGIGSLTR
jgi:hypothetical protein